MQGPDLVGGNIEIMIVNPALSCCLATERANQTGPPITAMIKIKSVHDHHSLGGWNSLTTIPVLLAILIHPFVPGDFLLH